MNVVLLEPDELRDGHARLGGRRAQHVAGVLGAGVGRVLRVGVVGGRLGQALVTAVGDGEVELDVVLDTDPPAPLACTLVLALPRPRVLHRVLGLAAAIGIKRIALFGSSRVEKSYWSSPVLAAAAVHDQLLLGLEQGGDTVLPRVTQHRRFRPFVEDDFPGLARGTEALLAEAGAPEPCPSAGGRPVALVVGPEGGLLDYETERFREAGCRAVSLGTRPLRVEHAVAVLLGRLF